MSDETKTTKKQATLTLAPKAEEASAPDSRAAEPVPASGELAPDAPASEAPAPAVSAEQAFEGTGVEMTPVDGDTVTDDGSDNAAPPIDEQPIEPEEEIVEFVQMVRDPDAYSEPHTATVHPAEVENYRLGGWEPAE